MLFAPKVAAIRLDQAPGTRLGTAGFRIDVANATIAFDDSVGFKASSGDVALSGPTLAILLEQSDGRKLILRFDVFNGKTLSGARVALAAQDLATGAGGTIFRVRRNIYLLGPKGLKVLQRASGTAIGLSIEGRRIAWAVNIKGRGRIVALTLPR